MFMPHFESPNHRTLDILKSDIDLFFSKVDYVIATSARFRNKNIKHINLEDLKITGLHNAANALAAAALCRV